MLVAAGDGVFDDLLAGRLAAGFQVCDGGVAAPEVLQMLQKLAVRIAASFTPAAWLIVDDAIAVGLCSLINVPGADGRVEIGYGVAASHRGHGVARRAIGDVITYLRNDGRISYVAANTAVNNLASQAVLAANGFVQTGQRTDPEDGELLCWERKL